MSAPDDFDDFLTRRKPLFRRPDPDPLEPPAELDRIVLRQARQAIQDSAPEPVYRGPGWGMPVALAATLLLVFAVILRVWVPDSGPIPEVTVQNVAQQAETASGTRPAAIPARESLTADRRTHDARDLRITPGGTVSDKTSRTEAPAPPLAAASPPSEAPWRRDAATWLAEIDRLRAEGRVGEAEAEMTEYKRQHRAYAGAPDR